jgi:hypothetical protein
MTHAVLATSQHLAQVPEGQGDLKHEDT